jgi:hypothetical protein
MAAMHYELPLHGGCACGAVRYTVTEAPKFSLACHCTDCQQLSSSAFSLGLAVGESGFAITQGEPRCWTKTGASGKPSHQYSCGICGGWTHTRPEASAGAVVVRPSTLDNHHWFAPVAEIFTRSALPWAVLNLKLNYPEEFHDPEPLVRAFQAG